LTAVFPEIAKVQAEILAFRDEYLPVFLDPEAIHSLPSAASGFRRRRIREAVQALPKWQHAVTKLGEVLSFAGGGAHRLPPEPEHFREFMHQPAEPSFCCSDNGIHWKIRLFVDMVGVRCWCWPSCLPPHAQVTDHEQVLRENLPQIKRWLFGLRVDTPILWNAFSFLLPFIADYDQPFVKLAFDLNAWQATIAANVSLPDDERQAWLRMLEGGVIRHVMNNGLLHVLGALANNHFWDIGDYLEHPSLFGCYTALMPHYLFAVLYHKVAILQQLAAEAVP
jgi:hypothetical protein